MSAGTRKKRALLFQQDPKTLALIDSVLSRKSFEIDLAADGVAGLDGVSGLTPDIVIADTDYPHFSGFDVLDTISRNNLDIPVIMTGEQDASSILSAFRSGAYDYITRPVDETDLAAAIDDIILKRQAVRESPDHENMRRLIRNVERHNRELSTLLDITSSFNVSGNSKKELLNRLTEVAAESMNCEAASIMLINERKKVLEFVVATGEKKTRLETLAIPMGEGIAGWVAINGEPQIVNDTQAEPKFTGSVDEESGFVTRQILAVPLCLDGRTIGVLEVINTRDQRALGEEDLRLLKGISERAATVIEATRTIEDQQNFFVQTTNIIVKAIEKKDLYSIGHSWQVAELAHRMAVKMNLGETEKSDLHYGCLLHDIGKLEMPGQIFNKRTISEREMEFIRQHPVKGAKLLEPITIWNGVVPHVLYHHEAWDGSGYPFGKTGQSIPLGARIINIAEAFSVMRSPNSYKRRMSIKEAILEIMRMSGKQFDPDLVKVFVNVLENDITVS